MFSVRGLGVVVMPVCVATFSFFFSHVEVYGLLLAFCFSLSLCFALPLHCAPPQTAGYTPTTHGSARDRHLISLVGGASQEGGGG